MVFAGRHIREKRAPAVPPAVAAARRELPGLRGVVFGDGPEREAVRAAIAAAGAEGFVEAPGFVEHDVLEAALRACAVHGAALQPRGLRHGGGRGGAKGTPSVVVAGEDNAAVELVEDGVNGVVAASAEPAELARAILRVHAGGRALRERTCAWFAANARRLSLESSLAQVAPPTAGLDSPHTRRARS